MARVMGSKRSGSHVATGTKHAPSGSLRALWHAWKRPARQLDRPIFVVGCSKSGTTLLASLLLAHPDAGPKPEPLLGGGGLQAALDRLLVDAQFDVIADEMEEKPLWDAFFPSGKVALRTGRELTLLSNPLNARQRASLIRTLARGLREPRRLSKGPFHTFRVHALRELFPDAKLLAIHRDGRDVIASWGRKHDRWNAFGGYASAIRLFARKWNEAVDHIERHKQALDIATVRYEDLTHNPRDELRRLLDFCELRAHEFGFGSLSLEPRQGLWRSRVPAEFHELVCELTARNRIHLGYADCDGRRAGCAGLE